MGRIPPLGMIWPRCTGCEPKCDFSKMRFFAGFAGRARRLPSRIPPERQPTIFGSAGASPSRRTTQKSHIGISTHTGQKTLPSIRPSANVFCLFHAERPFSPVRRTRNGENATAAEDARRAAWNEAFGIGNAPFPIGSVSLAVPNVPFPIGSVSLAIPNATFRIRNTSFRFPCKAPWNRTNGSFRITITMEF
uniref:Uncharacterized protein n=1 Tax=Candidatus Kentrum eta TaxID=2126337 RepID=A0A450VD24_9GAMM|nr:MAG: hypothetical protein BECKH772A_GA0070896_1010910 [Candidatus Kentron sp. H]VFJ97366.1 MAG: hypothetical protein BECKH772B_GA0070898_1011012 [Candidatus Kentron sp. H]VFK02693.1 MAG: hypothetical protein BECKH772C_GA0070978_1009912 [Candidatus Kentron sp. H]